jgi:hypothetical protein
MRLSWVSLLRKIRGTIAAGEFRVVGGWGMPGDLGFGRKVRSRWAGLAPGVTGGEAGGER